jgi:hypothetical protein
LEAKNFDPNSDDIKPFCRFLWNMYAGSYLSGKGPQDQDFIEELIQKM